MKAEELALTLKACRQPGTVTLTVEYENGCRQVIRPSAAWKGERRALAEAMAGNQPFTIVQDAND